MSGVLGAPEQSPQRPRIAGTLLRAAAFVLAVAVLGALAGVAWWVLVKLPAYRVGADGGASTSERGLVEFISADAWFTAIGFVAGLLVGLAAWRAFRTLGWAVVLLSVGAATVAALVCWQVGHQLGPGNFAARLTAAKPGDVVPIELTLRAKAALLTWPFGAVIPVLLGSSLGRDDEVPTPLFVRRAGARRDGGRDPRRLGPRSEP